MRNVVILLLKEQEIILRRGFYLESGEAARLSLPDRGKPIITVTPMNSEIKEVFLIAHMLGHYLLHKELLGIGVNDGYGFGTIKHTKYFNPDIGPKQEEEASYFARRLLEAE